MRVLIPQFDAETQVTFVYRHDSFFQSVRRCGMGTKLCAKPVSNGSISLQFVGSRRWRLPIPRPGLSLHLVK